jgi:type I restriction enzyme S subunit
MKRYDSYKDSGVEWIGEIPISWEVKRIKHTTYVKGRIGWQGMRSDEFLELSDSYVVTGTDFENGRIKWETCYQVPIERYDEDPFIQLKDGDLLITKDGTIGKVAVVENLAKIATLNSGVFLTRPIFDSYVPKFMYWILFSDVFKTFYDFNKSGSTIQHLYQNVFNEFKFPLPSHSEQTIIINFLDQKTTQIDDLIAKKERLIQLLEEERTAIINQAVTKGLDPTVPMKDSGIQWLGEIPQHWKYSSLKWYSKIYSGGTPSKDIDEYWINGTIPWLNSGCVNQWDITEVSEYITEEAFNKSSAKWIPPKSLVIALAGQGKTKGMVAQVQFETTCNQSLGVIVPNEKIYNRFLQYWLKNNYLNIRSLGGGDKRDGLNLVMIGGIPIPIPLLNEQVLIANFLDNKNFEFDTFIQKSQQEIELLKEYKTALISEVVTGKVDVSTSSTQV